MKGKTLTTLWPDQGGYAMVIQHNMNAMNARRQLGLTTGQLGKSSEKLSSGYKINRAADDAAGLSISEKMRKQIRGLDQASENIEDGISLCQVADGALNETISILQRMRELAVQSANGTNSASDREAIDMEITQLKNEVDRIAVTTSFNDAAYPLNAPITYSGIVTETINTSMENSTRGGLLHETTVSFKTGYSCTYEGRQYNTGDEITITGLSTNGTEIWISGGTWTSWFGGGWDSWYNNSLKSLHINDLKINKNGYIYCIDETATEIYAIYATPPIGPDPLEFEDIATASWVVNSGLGRFMTTADLDTVKQPDTWTRTQYYYNSNDGVNVHAGASSSQTNTILVHTVNATCKGLGIDELTTATEKHSTRAESA